VTANDFVIGANLPWAHYGLDFGASRWTPDGGVGRPVERARIGEELTRLADAGVSAIRWFLLCDGRAGITFDGDGSPCGLDRFVFRDLDAAIALAERHRLRVMFVLLDFLWCGPLQTFDGVQIGGRGAVLARPAHCNALLEFVFRPIIERFSRSPAILAWDLMNEPEWANSKGVLVFLKHAAGLVHSCATQPVTVGSAGVRWRKRYRDLGLDVYQVHWYDTLSGQPALDTPVDRLGFDRPVILGEFPTRGSAQPTAAILEAARVAGYAGAFYWSALSSDECSNSTAACTVIEQLRGART